jgi:hypothetical protein
MNKPTAAQLKDPQWWYENADIDAQYVAVAPGGRLRFYRKDGTGKWQLWVTHERQWFFDFFANNAGGPPYELIPRPTKPAAPEWEGLVPAVGDKCEAVWLEAPDGGSREYEPVLIKGYFKNETMKVWLSTRHGEDIVCSMEHCNFRMIVTRADRERTDAIVLAKYAAEDALGFEVDVEICGALYDAGMLRRADK